MIYRARDEALPQVDKLAAMQANMGPQKLHWGCLLLLLPLLLPVRFSPGDEVEMRLLAREQSMPHGAAVPREDAERDGQRSGGVDGRELLMDLRRLALSMHDPTFSGLLVFFTAGDKPS